LLVRLNIDKFPVEAGTRVVRPSNKRVLHLDSIGGSTPKRGKDGSLYYRGWYTDLDGDRVDTTFLADKIKDELEKGNLQIMQGPKKL